VLAVENGTLCLVLLTMDPSLLLASRLTLCYLPHAKLSAAMLTMPSIQVGSHNA
jgi:hypothetical protein